MVKKKEKYKWRDKEKHYASLNQLRLNESMRRCFNLFIKVDKERLNQNLPFLSSPQWPPEIVTRFEGGGMTIPENVYMKVGKF